MYRQDCRFFTGYKPCRQQSQCDGCSAYIPMGARVLILKLGAIGDALRTTPVLAALKKRHGELTVTWVTDDASYPLLEGIPGISRLMRLNFASFIVLQAEHFHLLLNFDKAPEACGFAAAMKADRKEGFSLTGEGKLSIYNSESAYAYDLGLFDDLKFKRNKLSYQEIIFSMAGLPFQGEEYELSLSPQELSFGEAYIFSRGIADRFPLIGLNTGCGDIFATKKWALEGFVALAETARRELGAEILLLGGPAETERNRLIEEKISFPVHNTGNNNTLKQFASFIRRCHLVVSADTTALHMAIALKVPVVALFGPTCHSEIYLYGRGEKVVSDFPCAPCYRGNCEKEPRCMDSIRAGEVMAKITSVFSRLFP
ncbi:MAG: glycosyltransferase family 9 protein [Candidatus Eremiobacteraeota bacterium]|nr:glycosyltransferase family 9 protein [Candidatus Eremiobacteraeota bacterium]